MSFSSELHIEIQIHGCWYHYSVPVIHNAELLSKCIKHVSGELNDPSPSLTKVTEVALNRHREDVFFICMLNDADLNRLGTVLAQESDTAQPENLGYLFGNDCGSFYDFPDDFPSEVDHVCAVYWEY